jgi:hypothetical protein
MINKNIWDISMAIVKWSAIALLFLSQNALGQVPGFNWGDGFIGSGLAGVNGLDQDSLGNVVVFGQYSGQMDFDPGTGTVIRIGAGSSDIFVCKLDAMGNYARVCTFGSSGIDAARSGAVDRFGNIYVAGWFHNAIDFDPGPGLYTLNASTNGSAVIVKLSSSGNFIWAKQISGSSTTSFETIAVDRSGNVYASGQLYGTADLDPGVGTFTASSNGSSDAFVIKLDAAGDFVWAKQLGGPSTDIYRSVVLDTAGNLLLGGIFSGPVDMDPGIAIQSHTSQAPSAMFVQKLDAAGNLVWNAIAEGTGGSFIFRLTADARGDVYVVGKISGTVDLDPGLGVYNLSGGSTDGGVVYKLTKSGKFRWAGAIPSLTNWAQLYDVGWDRTGYIYIGGNIVGTCDIDPTPAVQTVTAAGNADVLIEKLDTAGTLIWARHLGASGDDRVMAITARNESGVIYGGIFAGTVDFNPGLGNTSLTAGSASNMFVTKWPTCNPTSASIALSGCGSVTANGQTYTTSGFYSQILANARGCDSTLSIQVAILQPSFATITQVACDSFSLNGFTYHSTGTHVQHSTNAMGCDSTLTLNLTLGSSTSDTLTQTACGSFTYHNQIYTNSGTYIHQLTSVLSCDSTVVLQLTINQPSTFSIIQSDCDSFALNGQIYIQTGTFVQHLLNVSGCDSMITLNLTINSSDTSLTQIVCDSFALNGQTYFSSGTYTQTRTNHLGCDSTIQLQLVVNGSTDTSLSRTACDSLELNGWIYTQSGTYLQTIPNAMGCDSSISLLLNIHPSPMANIAQQNDTLYAIPPNAIYQWIRCDSGYSPIPNANGAYFIPTMSGSYAVIIDTTLCPDTSACMPLTVTEILEISSIEITLFPNPNDGRFSIEIPQEVQTDINVTIVDGHGKIVWQSSLVGNSKSNLDLSELSNGVYRLHIFDESNYNYKTFVKQ